jgi:hypothetical protein
MFHPLREMQTATKVTIGLVAVSGLVILGGANDLVGPTFWAGSTAGTGALDAIRDVIGLGLILIGIGLFMRREIARQIYFLVAVLGYLAILADAASAAPAVTIVSLVLQTIPIGFLTRRSVSSTFR